MSEITLYEAQKKKMDGLLDEHDLTCSFKKEQYPIVFTIRPLQDMESQLSMLEEVEDGTDYRSADAYMQWIFVDGKLETKVGGGTFSISKELRTKVENILVKMISYWQQYFFRDVITNKRLVKGQMPVINEDEADDGTEIPDAPEPEDPGDPDAPDGYDDGGDGEGYPDVDVDLDGALAPEAEAQGGCIEDPAVAEAARIVRMEGKATASLLQRRMNIGYAKATQLMDDLEVAGVIGPFNGSGPREVLPFDEPDDEAEGSEARD